MEQFDVVATPDAEDDVERCFLYIKEHLKTKWQRNPFFWTMKKPCIC